MKDTSISASCLVPRLNCKDWERGHRLAKYIFIILGSGGFVSIGPVPASYLTNSHSLLKTGVSAPGRKCFDAGHARQLLSLTGSETLETSYVHYSTVDGHVSSIAWAHWPSCRPPWPLRYPENTTTRYYRIPEAIAHGRDTYEKFAIVLSLRATAKSIYLVFPVDQQLRANEGRWSNDILTHTRYCSKGTIYTNIRPTLNLPTLRT